MNLELKDSACQCLYSFKEVEKWSIQLYIEFLFVVTNMESLPEHFEPHNTSNKYRLVHKTKCQVTMRARFSC